MFETTTSNFILHQKHIQLTNRKIKKNYNLLTLNRKFQEKKGKLVLKSLGAGGY